VKAEITPGSIVAGTANASRRQMRATAVRITTDGTGVGSETRECSTGSCWTRCSSRDISSPAGGDADDAREPVWMAFGET